MDTMAKSAQVSFSQLLTIAAYVHVQIRYALEALSVNEVSSGLLIDDTLSGVKVQIGAQLIMELLFGFNPDAYYR